MNVDGAAFTGVLHGVTACCYGIEIDANRTEQARALGIETLQANTMDVRCPAEAVSLLYLNAPYDWESGDSNNQRLELVFLEHSYRWLKAWSRGTASVIRPTLFGVRSVQSIKSYPNEFS
jgi:hypothetical protein